MKVGSQCGYCLMHRGHRIIQRSTNDEKLRTKAMTALLHLLGERYHPDAVPSFIGAERCRIIKQVTGCSDPYAELKKISNEKALALTPKLEYYVNSKPSEQRLEAALKVACVGNVIEFDIPQYSSDINNALKNLDDCFYINDCDSLKQLIGIGKKVLLLTDNAGEIAFDKLIVRELQNVGCYVIVAVKAGPSLNDALMEDAESVGITEEANKVITTGSDAIGINLYETSSEFNKEFYGSDLIISKGMANWETITEVPAPCPLMYVFRTKCQPVASTINTPMNVNIAKLVPTGWSL